MKKLYSLVVVLTLVLGGISFGASQPVQAETGMVSINGFDYPKEHKEALDHLNDIRAKMGIEPLELDPILTKAAQNHADYLRINGQTGHGEDSNKKGFTGNHFSERIRAVGSGDFRPYGEVISYDDENLVDTIDGFMDRAPMHRAFIVSQFATKIGFGQNGKTAVFNLGSNDEIKDPKWAIYPYDGQKDVGTYFMKAWENLSPLEGTDIKRSGFIISYDLDLEIGEPFISDPDVKLVDSKGNNVPFHDTDLLGFIIPKEDLKYSETYTVTISYGKGRSNTSTFTTMADPRVKVQQQEEATEKKKQDAKTEAMLKQARQYVDFEEDKYWSENMAWAIQRGFISGYEEKNPSSGKVEKLIKPATPLSEAQFLTILLRHSEGSAMLMTEPKDKNWWASTAYVIAEKLKIPTKGSHNNRKAAEATMTRGELAVILASYYNIKYNGGKALSERDAVQFMYDAGLSNGYADQNGNTPKTYDSYGADKFLLREHVVTFMWNYDNYLNSKTNQ